jgi:hypothetical protein
VELNYKSVAKTELKKTSNYFEIFQQLLSNTWVKKLQEELKNISKYMKVQIIKVCEMK